MVHAYKKNNLHKIFFFKRKFNLRKSVLIFMIAVLWWRKLTNKNINKCLFYKYIYYWQYFHATYFLWHRQWKFFWQIRFRILTWFLQNGWKYRTLECQLKTLWSYTPLLKLFLKTFWPWKSFFPPVFLRVPPGLQNVRLWTRFYWFAALGSKNALELDYFRCPVSIKRVDFLWVYFR